MPASYLPMSETAQTVQTRANAAKPKKIRRNPQRRKADREKAEKAEKVQWNQQSNVEPNSALTQDNTTIATNTGSQRPPITKTQSDRNISRSRTYPASPSRPILSKSHTLPPEEIRPNVTKTLVRSTTPRAQPRRTQSDSIMLAPPALITGGLVGCAASSLILLSTHLWHSHGGAETALLSAKSAALCTSNLLSEVTSNLQHGTYSADESLDILRRTTLAYASSIPGGASFVSKLFIEIDTVRKQRGREIDEVLREGYADLAKASMRGASRAEIREVVLRQLGRLSHFAGRGVRDVVDRNPGLKQWRDGAVRSLGGPSTVETGGGKSPTVKINMAVRQKV